MNYLTNYYKNLSEQLQERINYLQKQLNEAEVYSPGQMASAGMNDKRVRRRQEFHNWLINTLSDDHHRDDNIDKKAFARVLADIIDPRQKKPTDPDKQVVVEPAGFSIPFRDKFPAESSASKEDLEHVLAHWRFGRFDDDEFKQKFAQTHGREPEEHEVANAYFDRQDLARGHTVRGTPKPVPGFEQTMGDLNKLSIRPK